MNDYLVNRLIDEWSRIADSSYQLLIATHKDLIASYNYTFMEIAILRQKYDVDDVASLSPANFFAHNAYMRAHLHEARKKSTGAA